MCFLLRKIYDCQHLATITTHCHYHFNSGATCEPKDCSKFYMEKCLRSINRCPKCRPSGYKFISEKLQEYREHWKSVNWQKWLRLCCLKEFLPWLLEAECNHIMCIVWASKFLFRTVPLNSLVWNFLYFKNENWPQHSMKGPAESKCLLFQKNLVVLYFSLKKTKLQVYVMLILNIAER